MKRMLPLLLALVMLLTACGGGSDLGDKVSAGPAAKEFSADGLTITLTEEFEESSYVGYNAMYMSEHMACMILKESYSLFEGTDYSADSTVEDYGELLWRANEISGEPYLQKQDGLTFFEFEANVDGSEFTYRVYIFKSADAFWTVQFYTFSEQYNSCTDEMHSYALTVNV